MTALERENRGCTVSACRRTRARRRGSLNSCRVVTLGWLTSRIASSLPARASWSGDRIEFSPRCSRIWRRSTCAACTARGPARAFTPTAYTKHTAANLTLHCRTHNALAAEWDFGREHMAQRRQPGRHEALAAERRAAKPMTGEPGCVPSSVLCDALDVPGSLLSVTSYGCAVGRHGSFCQASCSCGSHGCDES